MSIDKVQAITVHWQDGSENVFVETTVEIELREQLKDLRKEATLAIVKMAEEMARQCYGIEADKQFWRLFVPREVQIALGWTVHQWHTPDDHDCRDKTSCMLCDLSVCRICGLYEGGLTTECPGENVDFDTSQRIYAGRLDFRKGKWVEEYGPHQQSNLLHQRWKRNARR